MSTSLYELTGQYLALMEMAQDDEIDPETLADTLESVEGELEDKADGYGKIIRSLEGDLEAINSEINRLDNKKKSVKSKIDRFKEALQTAMVATDKKNIETELFSFRIQKNPASLDIVDETKIPAQFWIQEDPKLDKRAALNYVKENGEQDWGRLKQGETLRIR